MSDYISRQDAIEWFRPYGLAEQKLEFWEIREQLEGLKAADVVPVVHARFVPHGIEGRERWYWSCSKCGQEYNTIFLVRYCLNCGAKMDEA